MEKGNQKQQEQPKQQLSNEQIQQAKKNLLADAFKKVMLKQPKDKK